MPAVLFLLLFLSGSALAQQAGPAGMARLFAYGSGCIATFAFRTLLLLVAPTIALLMLIKFLQIERKRDTGEVYADEIAGLMVLGLMFALLVRLTYETMEFFGVPVECLIYNTLYCPRSDCAIDVSCGTEFFTEISLPACREMSSIVGGEWHRIIEFSLSAIAAATRLLIFAAPLFTVFTISYKIYTKRKSQVDRHHEPPYYAAMLGLAEIFIFVIALIIYTRAVMRIVYVDYTKIVEFILRFPAL